MSPLRRAAAARRRLAAGIAIMMMLVAALAPAWLMPTATAAAGAAGWAEVCTADGVVRAAVDAGDTDGVPAPPNGGRGHCPLCLPHDGLAFILPVSSWCLFRPVEHGRIGYRTIPTPPIRQAIWPAFQSRGPPMPS